MTFAWFIWSKYKNYFSWEGERKKFSWLLQQGKMMLILLAKTDLKTILQEMRSKCSSVDLDCFIRSLWCFLYRTTCHVKVISWYQGMYAVLLQLTTTWQYLHQVELLPARERGGRLWWIPLQMAAPPQHSSHQWPEAGNFPWLLWAYFFCGKEK